MTTVSQLRRMGLFDSRVPRYTSYPPANQFSSATDVQQFEGWIKGISAGTDISLYVHIPFCRRLCWFCACRTQGTTRITPVRRYVATLIRELKQIQARLPARTRLSRLHWGGGTPTLMPPDLIRQLAGAILEAFPLCESGEFSVEIDPSEIDEARMRALARAGMTRASIGIQDFDPTIQAAIGRPQGFEVTQRTVCMILDHGISSINADILYGLPCQNRRHISETVQKLLALSPDRIALYGYAHVPWMSKRQVMISETSLPDPEARLGLFSIAQTLFLADGFRQIGIDHFARPSDGLARASDQKLLRRNFQGYTDDAADVLIGLGASAISQLPQGYLQNATATGAYTSAIQEGRPAIARAHTFTAEDIWRGRMIEALMCDFQIDAAEFRQKFGLTEEQLQDIFQPLLAHFETAIETGPWGLRILPQARALTRMIANALDMYSQSPTSHSLAI